MSEEELDGLGRVASQQHMNAANLLHLSMADEGWTVTTLAEHTGVSVSVIRLYLRGNGCRNRIGTPGIV